MNLLYRNFSHIVLVNFDISSFIILFDTFRFINLYLLFISTFFMFVNLYKNKLIKYVIIVDFKLLINFESIVLLLSYISLISELLISKQLIKKYISIFVK